MPGEDENICVCPNDEIGRGRRRWRAANRARRGIAATTDAQRLSTNLAHPLAEPEVRTARYTTPCRCPIVLLTVQLRTSHIFTKVLEFQPLCE